jgi:hypothetical protein
LRVVAALEISFRVAAALVVIKRVLQTSLPEHLIL